MSAGEIEALAMAENAAASAYWSLKKERSNAVDEARQPHLNAARDAEYAVMADYADRMAAAVAAETAAREAHAAARIAAAESGEGLPYPLGTVLHKWQQAYYNSPHVLSGERAVLQVFKQGDDYPTNRTSYGRPAPGDHVLRMLKKDGKPGALAIKFHADMASYWLPDGVKHASCDSEVAK